MESRKPCLLSGTVIVSDFATLELLFAHRLLSSVYSKRPVETNSRKRVVHEVRRKRPRIEHLQPAAENQKEGEPGVEKDENMKGDKSSNGTQEVNSAAAPVIVPGDHRVHMRTNLAQEESEDRKHNLEEFRALVVLPLRMLPEEARTALDLGLIRLQASPGKLWLAVCLPEELRGDNAPPLEERIDGWPYPSIPFEALTWRVFKELHRRGWILTKGTNFGSDYLLYTSDPGTTHSTFSVLCVDQTHEHVLAHPVKWCAVTALATKVRKTALLACAEPKEGAPWGLGDVHFTLVEGCLFRRSDFLNGKALEEQAIRELQEEERTRHQRENPLLYMSRGDDDEDDLAEDQVAV